jgi:hypothetical protein
MPVSGKICIQVTWFVSILVITAVAFAGETSMSERALASDTIIKDSFQAGTGLPVGKIQSVRGETYIFHRDLSTGYRAKTGLPLYPGDILLTRKDARMFCRLVDGSSLAMAPQTVITLLKANLNSARKSSQSFIAQKQGAVRYMLNPVPGMGTSEFKVDTATAFIQARKADFIVNADPGRTAIINLENSPLAVTNLADPEEIHFLSDYQRAVVRRGSVFPLIEAVPPEDAEELASSFQPAPDNKWFNLRAFNLSAQDTTGATPEE